MKHKEEILTTLAKHKESLYSKYPIQSIAIFGSVSRGEDSESSDVDLMVEFNDKIGIRFIDFADEVESILQCNVDVVSKNAIKPKYYQFIKNDLIYV